jgi:anti-anti-sigma regulatory factor
MFRLTERCAPRGLVLKLEGRCSSEVVAELDAGWQAATRNAGGGRIWVDLSDVLAIDEAGRAQLARMHRAGVRFVTRGCFTRALIREIRHAR